MNKDAGVVWYIKGRQCGLKLSLYTFRRVCYLLHPMKTHLYSEGNYLFRDNTNVNYP